MQTALIVSLWILSLLLALFIGGYLKGYMQRKGENLATHEDIEKLVDQMKAVTQATKEIETKISGELWDRQKQWELKREVLFEGTRRVLAVFDALRTLANILQTEVEKPEHKEALSWRQGKVDANLKYFETVAALEESELLAALTCERAVVDAINEYRRLVVEVGKKISTDHDSKTFDESFRKIIELRRAVGDAFRKDLGID